MKLPIAWLLDYLPEDFREGAAFENALAAACRRWDLETGADIAQTLARLMTFAGFGCDGITGSGRAAILELDVLSNRPDGQCILGLAREAAAILQVQLNSPPCDLAGKERGPAADTLAKVSVAEPELCPRYTARVIRGVKVGPSPKWLQDRLQWMGMQPRNNIVDVTNFICFELNQPLHAFDLNTLAGRRIIVRRARANEPFTPLYGEIPPLTPETLVIADEKNARAVAGVLGGKGSEVTPETTDILLEAAYFNPANTRRTVRWLKVMDGRGTDSSYRFERGIDLERVAEASARAARLIVEAAGGAAAPGILDVWPSPRAPRTIALRFAELNRVFGAPIPPEAAYRILTALGAQASSLPENAGKMPALQVTVPSWRRGDLEREIDLIEEVARLHGYNHVPAVTAMSARVPPRAPLETAGDRLRTLFTALGYFEAVSDSLIDPKWPAPEVWTKQRPLLLDKSSVLREDHSGLRNSLFSSLLGVRRYNQDRRTGEARLFELGKVFLPGSAGVQPEERHSLCLIDDRGFQPLADAIGRIGEALELDGAQIKLSAPQETPDFLQKGWACRVELELTPPTPPFQGGENNSRSPLKSKVAVVLPPLKRGGRGGEYTATLGWLGVISPELQKAFDLRKPVAMCELDLAALANLPSAPKRFVALPAFPEIARDVALVVDEQIAWEQIESFAREWVAREPLRDKNEPPRFLSVFRGKQAGAGKKSLAFSVIYRAADRTLTDEEVNAAHQKFQQALLAHFKAALRQ